MDLVHDERANVILDEELKEDRISKLPDDFIHHILSFLDMKYAIQTSTLSKKWEHIWTSIPQLNFDSHMFHTIPQFAEFVKHALSHRNNRTQVSTVDLTFTGAATQFVVKSIIDYAFSHNVQQLKINWFTKTVVEFPQNIFSSHTLKHLTLVVDHQLNGYRSPGCYIWKSVWDFPVLETLNLRDIRLGDGNKDLNLFSKCVNLKELTLHDCSAYSLGIFSICAPKLSSLTITGNINFAKVFNVVASHLENLTLTITSTSRFNFLEMSPEGLKKVNLSLSVCRYANEIYLSVLLDLFPKLQGVKNLILDWRIIETLSSCFDQLSDEPCPFDNLKCLKINTRYLKQKDHIATMAFQVKSYLLENSPNAYFIMDLPQVPLKRSMVNNDAMTNKMAKLEAEKSQPDITAEEKRMLEEKIQIQDEVISEQKTMLEALKLQHEKLMSHIINSKMAKLDTEKSQPETIAEVISEQKAINTTHLVQNDCIPTIPTQVENSSNASLIMDLPQLQVSQKRSLESVHNEATTVKKVAKLDEKMQMHDKVIADQKAMFEAKIQMQDEVIAKQRVMFEAKFQMQDKVVADQKAKLQIQDQVIAEQKVMFEAKIQMQHKFIAEQNEKVQMLEATLLQNEQLMSHIIKCKIAELKVQVESENLNYEVIRLIGCDIKSAMDLIPESLKVVMEAQFSLQYVELKSLLLARIDASQWAQIETELGNIRNSHSVGF